LFVHIYIYPTIYEKAIIIPQVVIFSLLNGVKHVHGIVYNRAHGFTLFIRNRYTIVMIN